MSEYSYNVILTPEDSGGFSVDIPALPGCHTCGETRQEAIAMAKDAIQLYIDYLIAENKPIPPSKKPANY